MLLLLLFKHVCFCTVLIYCVDYRRNQFQNPVVVFVIESSGPWFATSDSGRIAHWHRGKSLQPDSQEKRLSTK